ncbi:MAG: glycoside hydrolase family 71/99-like protein [Pirellulales bacterium]
MTLSLLVAIAACGRHPLADETVDLGQVRATWMRPTQVVPEKKINREGLAGRVLCGYQGWFTAEGDGADLQWHHWRIRDPSRPDGTKPGIDMLPDVGELGRNERFASDLVGADGRPVELFSSHMRPTVLRHFRWMRDYGIDGVFVQRFGVALRDPKRLAHFTKVLGSCRDGAIKHGRVYAVMYDLTGMEAGSVGAVLEDWRHLRRRMKIGDDAAALQVVSRPLVAVWGIGFGKDRDYSLDDCRQLVAALKADGCAVLCGVPTGWRTLDRDSTRDPALHEIIAMCDVVCPWTVGRYATTDEAARHAERSWATDIEWCRERNISYLPVVFPGFSWQNRKGGKLDQIPRLGGRFLWTQAVEARRAGAEALYVAMFDEVDEATAIFKCIDPPTPELAERFIGMENLPSDHYLRLTGEIGRLLRSERLVTDETPAFVPMP